MMDMPYIRSIIEKCISMDNNNKNMMGYISDDVVSMVDSAIAD
jgi:hypothetical protein